ncbi:MAG: nuclear transport factor 2 family protein [Acidimicrobiia bacterium]|nr:nuclear transport factor 2 family protein [Acidimicrobiia bacterium]
MADTERDRWAIHDLTIDYAVAVDTRDWETFAALWVPDAHIDYTSAGGIAGNPAEVTAWLAEAMRGFAMTQHSTSTHQVRLDGDTASGRLNVLARHGIDVDGEMLFLDVGGWYEDAYVRTTDGWRFSARTEHTLFFDGDFAARHSLERVPVSARMPPSVPEVG